MSHELLCSVWGLLVNSYCSATVELMCPELLLSSWGTDVALQFTATSPALPLATATDSSSAQVVEGGGAGHTLLAHGSSLLKASSTTAA